jgi:signal transduction histidine kinase/CheY-like chemotaxis protein
LWIKHDRGDLQQYALPIFSNLREKSKITHLYFHETDCINFLRVHQPERYGDAIDRFTMRQSADTGVIASGIELGPLGTFTLRMVYPWHIKDKLAGYIEVGEEIGHITHDVQQIIGVDLVVLIEKKYLDRKNWESGMTMLGHSAKWDLLPNEAVVYKHPENLPDNVIESLTNCRFNNKLSATDMNLNEKKYRVGVTPLRDAGERIVGRIVNFQDITEAKASATALVYGIGRLFIILSILFFGLGYWYLGRIEKRLDKSNRTALAEAEARERGQALHLEEMHRKASELQKSNMALEQAKLAAQAATRAKSEFLANMSHEIRTPMTAILGFSDVLMDFELSEQDRLNAIETILRNGQYLLHLIDEVLDLSKIDAEKMTIESSNCSVSQLLCDVLNLIIIPAREKGLNVFVECDGPIPETIRTDSTRLRQILINLVGNAVKFTEIGEIRLVASLQQDNISSKFNFDVIDTGIGISSDQLERIFDPFTQADETTTRKYGGTGLGLAICQRLSIALGGNITVKSQLGQGSTFRLSIPTGPLEGVALINLPQEPFLVKNAPRGESNMDQEASMKSISGRILLVEDGRDNQTLISFILSKAGAEVTLAENGRVAVDCIWDAIATSTPFDLVLMDMQMPVMDGYMATRKLRDGGYDGPIIALTAYAMSEDREKCNAAGCDFYVSKPIKRETLIAAVAQFLPQPEEK